MSFIRLTGIAAATAFALTANVATAQGGYGSLSYFDWEIERTDFPKLSSTSFRAVGGYMFDANVGIEGHVASGGTDDLQLPLNEGASEEPAEAELNKLLSVFARGNLPVTDRVSVFGLFGYSYGHVEILAETTATSQSESGFSWGAGAEVALVPDRLYLSLDHVEYVSQHDVDANATSLGLRLSFSGQ